MVDSNDARNSGNADYNQIRRVDYDAELQLHNEVLREAYRIHRRDRVLDIGCGTGQTTRDAARLAVEGSAVGVDISAPMIEQARELTEAEGLRNVIFEQADAALHPFSSDGFDVVISRFGMMFFADPIVAFANIGRALRPDGRLVMMVWQDHNLNEWSVSIEHSLTTAEVEPSANPGAWDAFSLADPGSVEHILGAADFVQTKFTDVHVPVYYGENVAAGLDWICRFSCVNHMLRQLDSVSRERALERLRTTLAAHNTGRGVWFDSRSWIVTARRR